ncbi:MAG: transglutaminase domain-containing protein [Clostridiales bacterium]|nr:transglutaminase domain-containing protein [Clostridiales bacterium]
MRNERTVSARIADSPSFLSAVIVAAVSVCLSTGFILMPATAFGFDYDLKNVLIFSIIASAAFSFLYFIRNKWVTLASLTLAPVALAVMLAFNILGVREGLLEFIERYSAYIVNWVEFDDSAASEGQLAVTFFMAYCLVAISLTTYCLLRRKAILPALVIYLPFFVSSVTNVVKIPDQIPVIVASIGVFMALIIHILSHKRRDMAEKMVLILSVPVILFGVLMGAVFPQEDYDKNELATDILDSAKETFDEASKDKDSLLGKILDIAQNGWRTSALGNGGGQFTTLSSATTYLNDVGPFNPSTKEMFKIQKYKTSGFYEYMADVQPDGRVFNFIDFKNNLYLKIESLDTYENNQLTASSIDMNVYPTSLSPLLGREAPYYAKITPLQPYTVDIVPYYADHYYDNDHYLDAAQTNPYTSTYDHLLEFAFAPLPNKTGNIYMPQYIDEYVHGTCLKVPESTERALITSGKLPQWYLDVYFGRAKMSDADKVRKVTDFVRNLHPYDMDTDYPPKGGDFVPWFVTDAESGICIHYAATSMVLLRMLGVPARYVRGYVDTSPYDAGDNVVMASQAHAWFEFFVPEYGWIMGDATPGYQTDASNFNIDAVAAYDPEIENVVFSEEISPIVTYETVYPQYNAADPTTAAPTSAPKASSAPASSPTPSPSPTPFSRGADVKVTTSDSLIVARFKIAGIVLLSIVVLVALMKLALALYWKNRFSAPGINERTIAYYHYYCFTARFVGGAPLSDVKKIAEKAAFSGEDLSRAEYDELLSLVRRYTFEISGTLKGLKWLLYKLLTIKISERPRG